MVRLFVSDRIFIDGDFYNGGIVVNSDGKIGEVFRDCAKVEKWLESSENVEVNKLGLFGKVFRLLRWKSLFFVYTKTIQSNQIQ